MKISLKKKKLKSGKLSLYIEYYKGSNVDQNGLRKHIREFEYLKLYLYQFPKSPKEKKENKEALELAENICAIKQSDYIQGKYSIKNTKKGKLTFLIYFEKLMEDRFEQKSNYDNWDAAFKHLKKYCSPNITFDDIDEDFIRGFKKFLEFEALTKSNTLLSQNSKYTYFNKFKAAIRQAYEDDYISKNYLKKVKGFEQGETHREYLTFEEVQALSNTECKYPVLKRAFIFSCLSGLRWSDVNKLIWSEIRDEENQCRVLFTQKKTLGVEYLYLSKESRELLGERTFNNDRVFTGLKYGATYNSEILKWCMRAGITKHITFHSSRHTNAVLLLENGADIYTVQKRLGHKEIKTTEIYAKIIDKKMKEAADIIPSIKL